MSDPMTLKPAAYACQNCKQATDSEHKGYRCTWCGLVFRYDVPLFTRDDLVRAVFAATGPRGAGDCPTMVEADRFVSELLGEVEK